MKRRSEILLAGLVAGAAVACVDVATDSMGGLMSDAGDIMVDMSHALRDAGVDLGDAGGSVRGASRAMVGDASAQDAGDEYARTLTGTCDTVLVERSVTYTGDSRMELRERFFADLEVSALGVPDLLQASAVVCGYSRTGPQPECPEGAVCEDKRPSAMECRSAQVDIADGLARIDCGYRHQSRTSPGGGLVEHSERWETAILRVTTRKGA